jgi:glycosyltransferase involved in cell wall biosynthesis
MVTGAYYPELAGGSLQCRSLILALRDRVRFSVLTTTVERSLPSSAEVDGVTVHRIFVDPKQSATKLMALPRLLGRGSALAAGHDVFHFHGFTEKMLVLFAIARLSGRRIVEKLTSVGWDDPIAIRSRPFGGLLAAGIARADRLIAVSPAVEERCRLAGLGADRLRSIPNGVDVVRFAPADDRRRSSLRARLVPRHVDRLLVARERSACAVRGVAAGERADRRANRAALHRVDESGARGSGCIARGRRESPDRRRTADRRRHLGGTDG